MITRADVSRLGLLLALVLALGNLSAATDWEAVKPLPWDILILFGGGLSLAAAIAATGVDAFIGSGFAQFSDVAPYLLILAVTAAVILLTEITSNTAVTTTLMPVLAATAIATGAPPGMLLTAATMAASCAFMLPVATPPNAIVFGTERIRVTEMARAGFLLNFAGTVLIVIGIYFLGRVVWGIDLDVMPEWAKR